MTLRHDLHEILSENIESEWYVESGTEGFWHHYVPEAVMDRVFDEIRKRLTSDAAVDAMRVEFESRLPNGYGLRAVMNAALDAVTKE